MCMCAHFCLNISLCVENKIMLLCLQGRSEYKTNFKWLESFRDKKFKPSPEQMAPPAGMGSIFSSASSSHNFYHSCALLSFVPGSLVIFIHCMGMAC